MIKLNTDVNTKSGIVIASGAILNITPYFKERRLEIVNEQGEGTGSYEIKYDISFDAKIYKDMETYENNGSILIKQPLVEFRLGHTEQDVDIMSFVSITDIIEVYANYIENGDSNYPGLGVGNCEIIYPYGE